MPQTETEFKQLLDDYATQRCLAQQPAEAQDDSDAQGDVERSLGAYINAAAAEAKARLIRIDLPMNLHGAEKIVEAVAEEAGCLPGTLRSWMAEVRGGSSVALDPPQVNVEPEFDVLAERGPGRARRRRRA